MKTLRKLKRETVPDTNFSLNKVQWSPWEQVISPIRPYDDCAWTERYRGRKGYRKTSIFGGKTLPAAAYEFSVRKQSDPKRSVTYCKLSSGFTSARSWEARLLCHSKESYEYFLELISQSDHFDNLEHTIQYVVRKGY